jgi:hypothetical protein
MRDQVHRDLVAHLSDEEALEKMRDGWLSAEEWGPAIERVRTRWFGEQSVAEGNRRVGAMMGESLLASKEGQVARLSLESLPRRNVFEKFVPMMGERLRQSIRFEWSPSPTGGVLRVLGQRSTPAEVTLGFFEVVARLMSPPPTIAIEHVDEVLLTFRVEGL